MSCTPKDVYTALIKAGFSTVQAVGAMANGIAESGLDAETRVVDSNGYYSDGIWQFNEATYPNAAGLITGNCSADITAQVGFLKASVSGQALNGSSGGEVAGNFAQYFEKCQTCTPGGTSYDQRVANAATVAGWISSGSWPTSTAGLAGGSGTASAAAAAATGPDCAFGPDLPVVGTICLMKKTTIRHIVGGALIVAGSTVAGLGVILLAAFAFRASGALRAAADAAAVVPGGGAAAAGLSAAHSRATRTGAQARQQRQAATP
jgi:Phage tail lysozyme